MSELNGGFTEWQHASTSISESISKFLNSHILIGSVGSIRWKRMKLRS